jgi:hypothetical protein
MPSSDVPLTTRTERTTEKTRQGGLLASSDGKVWVGLGSANVCSGCGEVIGKGEREFEVEVAVTLTFRFHDECHQAWVIFRQQRQYGRHDLVASTTRAARGSPPASRSSRLSGGP